LTGLPRTLDEHQAQERRLHLLDDQEAQQKIVVDVLIDEEAAALHEWTQKKQDVAALEKLHDRAFEEWQMEMSREEQAFLDEWSSSRRAA
jgi:flagellar export protein FliJ